ncbi:MAG: EamA family transporter RarD [Desulfuromonadales bacterium]|nr:EamA family transporter RarD [Desulfuromonadales bacterium]MBN2793311.1 EamA family transporter RarD [Desulfuromonadales bacterium]
MKITESPSFSARTKVAEPVDQTAKKGVLYGVLAYSIWGSFPVFFKALDGATPLEIVSHRIFWSAVFLFILVVVRQQLGALRSIFNDRWLLLTLCGSTLLIATNWLTFLYAVQRGEVLQSSLGYFMTPLISVLLGFVFLQERLSLWQKISVLCAFLGVLNLAFHQGQFPWLALILACSFALYGLLRKLAQVEAMVGLTVETALLAPLSLGYLLLLFIQQQGAFLEGSLCLNALLPLSGLVTAIPLLFFIGAARRLRLATVGFLQYITPSLHFLLAVGLYGEEFSSRHFVSFLLIWIGLGVYSADTLWKNRPVHQHRKIA